MNGAEVKNSDDEKRIKGIKVNIGYGNRELDVKMADISKAEIDE